MAESIRLTETLLEELAAQWRRHDVAIARRLQPGLSEREMDALVQPLGIRVPTEARVWWGWHNGAHDASIVTGGGKTFSSLERCVSLAAEMREMAHDVTRPYRLNTQESDEMAQGVWRREWLPLSSDGVGSMLVIDASLNSEPRDVCPVWYRAIDDNANELALVAPSIGALVQQWTIILQNGRGSHDDHGQRWTLDRDTLPAGYDSRLL